MQKNTVRSLLVSSVVAALGVTGAVLAAPASAALPSCTANSYLGLGPYYLAYPTTELGSTNCLLGYGNVSRAVRTLQETLNQCYGQRLLVDGKFQSKTQAALKSVQRAVGVKDDGIYGPNTARAMKHPEWYISGDVFEPLGRCA